MKRQSFDQIAYDRIYDILEHKDSINKDNCGTFKKEDLQLPGVYTCNVEQSCLTGNPKVQVFSDTLVDAVLTF